MSDTFDVNSPEATLMRLHESLDEVGKRLQALADADRVDDSELNWITGFVQGMVNGLDMLGYGADR